eukprot:COSAG02_NODE_36204_length_457_cov_17.128492_1_plen_138_part_10
MLGTKIYYQFFAEAVSTEQKFINQMHALTREIGDRGKIKVRDQGNIKTKSVSEGVPPASTPAQGPPTPPSTTPTSNATDNSTITEMTRLFLSREDKMRLDVETKLVAMETRVRVHAQEQHGAQVSREQLVALQERLDS